MPSLDISEQAGRDLRGIYDFIALEDPQRAASTISLILDSFEILKLHPLIGRAVDDPLRELIISRGHSGYIALYWHDRPRDRIIIKAVRHQREIGFDETEGSVP